MNKEKKKISLQEMINQKLNNKKQEQANSHISTKPVKMQKMKNQQSKKTSNTRRKMGV